MSEYLDQLIRDLEVEADEERAALEQSRAKGLREPKNAGGQLKRTLQRLEILKSLRISEAVQSRARVKAKRRTANRATGSRDLVKAAGGASALRGQRPQA